jgi:hypothetical protein
LPNSKTYLLPLIEQYQIFELARDLNPVIVNGMLGTILQILRPDEVFEVEFVKDEVSNYEFDGQFTFTISIDDIILSNSH